MTNITNGEEDATVVFIDIIPYPTLLFESIFYDKM